MMSIHHQDSAKKLDSISPFSSLDSDLNLACNDKKLAEEKLKNIKLEEKLAGYKTVAQCVPKFQAQIRDLQLELSEKKKTVTDLENQLKEQKPKTSTEEQRTEGLTDLAHPISATSPAATRSPSFVILNHPKGVHDSTNHLHEKATLVSKVSSPLPQPVSSWQERELSKGTQCRPESLEFNTKIVLNPQSKPNSFVKNSVRSPSYNRDLFFPVTESQFRPIVSNKDLTAKFGMSNITNPPEKDIFETVKYPTQNPEVIYGIGARPKEWAPLNFSGRNHHFEPEKIIPADKMNTSVQLSEYLMTNQLGLMSQRTNMLQVYPKPPVMLDQQLLDISSSSNDLMKFSIAGSSPSEKNEMTAFSDKSKGVTNPSDDHYQLASQAESMAAILKASNPPSGMSEMLLEFSKEVGKLEAQLQEKQAQIQRQQVQIQSYAKNIADREIIQLREENKNLKEENENLLAVIMTHAEDKGLSAPLKELQWVPLPSQTTSDMNRNTQPESPLIRKVEMLDKMNAKLFLANKDWHSKWELLRQSNHEQIVKLDAKVESLMKENEHLKDIIEKLQKEMLEEKANQEKNKQKIVVLEGEKINFHKFVDSLKRDVELLTREKRKLDAELTSFKAATKLKNKEEAGARALEGEVTLLKQQLTIFTEDFEKERQDRTTAESKVEKIKKDKEKLKMTYDNRIKQFNTQFKNLEDTLRNKNRQVAELQVQLEDLKLQLHSAQRKVNIVPAHSLNLHLPPSTYGPTTHLFTNSGAESSFIGSVNPLTGFNIQQGGRQLRTGPGPPVAGPEHQVGAWTCKECTYINYPSRSVCDICGYTNLTGDQSLAFETGGQELHSRGDHLFGFRDIEADSTQAVIK